MENSFEINEPVTIKITIEVIPSKKKEHVVDIKEQFITPRKDDVVVKPKGWDAIEPETPTLIPPVEPIAPPEKKKRAYTKKTKTTEEVVKGEPVGEKKPTEESPIVEEAKKEKPVKPITSANPNKVVARLAQMIRFYCKASNIPTTEITKKYLIDHGAADIIEGATDEDIEDAFKEVVKK